MPPSTSCKHAIFLETDPTQIKKRAKCKSIRSLLCFQRTSSRSYTFCRYADDRSCKLSRYIQRRACTNDQLSSSLKGEIVSTLRVNGTRTGAGSENCANR